ncbi:Major facilitator superfamily domain general substrate transporter [Penicillium samsonianum]|uniref:Major facilitator superfamily domain general substrate transporter n=1 Tax=Penicillium samsonianum TaxID=1882272 RepID=UPI002549C0F0|nr:Major facilitator superfamily domain general substrate transporter [Penicillium samsonianum]KAJ6118648.1 Major facilitator superfamily domain general substrate transporter [Penicillium samsonianum]
MGLVHIVMISFKEQVTAEQVEGGGFTHVYVTQFDNEEDRDYYLRKDAAHEEFGKIVGPLFKSAQVNDFVPGVSDGPLFRKE